MRTVRALPLLIALAAALSCQADVPAGVPGGSGGGPTGPGGGGAHNIDVRDNFYSPNATSVSVGDTVTWTWQGSNPHSVTFVTNTGPDFGVHTAPYSVSFLMVQSGVFTYYSTPDGQTAMSGTITVQ